MFLQEVWYRKDYNFLKGCLQNTNYKFSDWDEECGQINDVLLLNWFISEKSVVENENYFQLTNVKCSGIVTLSKHKLRNQRFEKLTLGDDYATENIIALWADYLSSRKVLYTDIQVLFDAKLTVLFVVKSNCCSETRLSNSTGQHALVTFQEFGIAETTNQNQASQRNY